MTMANEQRAASHDANGRFAKGNAGGPGNPHVRRIAMMREAVASAVSLEDLVAVMRKLLELATEGDREAAKLVLHYTVGKPSDFQAELRLDLCQETPPAADEVQHPARDERPAVARPAVPSATPTPAERFLGRRGESDKSVEEMLGIAPRPPIANGGNGPALTSQMPTASRPSGAADTGRATKS